ncbi:MAG: flagellar basal body-associated FliL family protein [Treponema sp.]|jgi:flagellar basal body-associated protein FliL|nr:flagellar basal body-associated FliL family protein [Treponema sp.]
MTNLPASPPARGLTVFFRVLCFLALILAFCILAGTLYAAYRGPGSGPLIVFRADKTARPGTEGDNGTAAPERTGIFTGIGRLRIPVAGGDGTGGAAKATLILSIAFPYPPGDRAFAEELASRVGDFRSIAVDYFSSRSAAELRNPDEDALKAELLRRYNAILMLGNIEALYFNDLLIFE